MINIRWTRSLKPHEWMSLAGGGLLLVSIYALLVHPSLTALNEIPQLRAQRDSLRREMDQARAQLQQAETQAKAAVAQLDSLGGAPPPAEQKDLQIARLSALAEQSKVRVNQFSPLETLDFSDHRAFLVEFTGQGSFPDVQALFARIESSLDFVDVTNFAITAVQSLEQSDCHVSWSCRINGLHTLPAEQSPAPIDQKQITASARGGGPT